MKINKLNEDHCEKKKVKGFERLQGRKKQFTLNIIYAESYCTFKSLKIDKKLLPTSMGCTLTVISPLTIALKVMFNIFLLITKMLKQLRDNFIQLLKYANNDLKSCDYHFF